MLGTHGFTLVELLVVVTIIVILIALLTPAMDRAIYQAELAVCAANQRAIASASSTYAAGHRRLYPTASVPRVSGAQPHALGAENDPGHDVRLALEAYVPFNHLRDPLSQEVDLGFDANDTDTTVFSSYQFWMGWQYTGAYGGKGMMRLGDRVNWIDDLDGTARQRNHDFLVTGLLSVRLNNNAAEAAHIDSAGRSYAKVLRNQDWVLGTNVGISKVTVSFYETASGPRGTVDQNFASADGSVVRHNGVTGDWSNVADDRGNAFHPAPWHADSAAAHNTDMRYLPGNG